MLEILEELPNYKVKVKCHKCCLDPELFGDGVFIAFRHNINKGRLPCGCAKRVKWTKEQYKVMVERRCDQLNLKLSEFPEDAEVVSSKSPLKISCNLHGDFQTNIFNFLYNGNACPSCKKDTLSALKTFPEDYFIDLFRRKGAHNENTVFKRLENDYWSVACGFCGEENFSITSNLRRGTVPCSCRFTNRRYFYLMMISENSLPIALKFGITSDVKRRVVNLNKKSSLDISLLSLYEFSSRTLCQKVESLCKSTLICGVIDEQLMRDGSTETTYLSNYDTIINIIYEGGGVEIER